MLPLGFGGCGGSGGWVPSAGGLVGKISSLKRTLAQTQPSRPGSQSTRGTVHDCAYAVSVWRRVPLVTQHGPSVTGGWVLSAGGLVGKNPSLKRRLAQTHPSKPGSQSTRRTVHDWAYAFSAWLRVCFVTQQASANVDWAWTDVPKTRKGNAKRRIPMYFFILY